jgi:hypothetical protein
MTTPTAMEVSAASRRFLFDLVREPSQTNGKVAMINPAAYAADSQPVRDEIWSYPNASSRKGIAGVKSGLEAAEKVNISLNVGIATSQSLQEADVCQKTHSSYCGYKIDRRSGSHESGRLGRLPPACEGKKCSRGHCTAPTAQKTC